MNRNFKYFGFAWLINLIVFNVLVFVVPAATIGSTHFEHSTFWIGYILVLIAFFAQIICGYLTLRGQEVDKIFLRLPILYVVHSAVITSTFFGALFLLIPSLPGWIGGVVAILVSAFFGVAALKATALTENVETIGEKAARKAAFIRALSIQAQALVARANDDLSKATAKRVYDAIRYSDPMSVPALNDIEEEIFEAFNRFDEAIQSGDTAAVALLGDKVILLIGERNNKCKLLKA